MKNVRPEGTKYQSVTSPSGEALGSNFHVRHSKCIRNYPQWYDPGFLAARECNNNAVASIVYIIKCGDLNSNLDTYEILLLLA